MAIKVFCDRCGSDCDLVAYDLQIGAIHNPTPVSPFDHGDAKITDVKDKLRLVLCQKCYRSLGLPNIYEANVSKTLNWEARNNEEN